MEDENLIFSKTLARCLELPGARVNRANFLWKNLRKYCFDKQAEDAIRTSIKYAEVSEEVLEQIARSVINRHTLGVTGTSTLTGMPGGLAMVATVPTDLVQYYYHVVVLAQKLAYLYGYPQFDEDNDGSDDLVSHLTLFIGVMYSVDGAHETLLNVTKNKISGTLTEVPEKTLSETTLFLAKKNIARWMGIKFARKTFTRSLSKAIPIVSGLVSGGVTYFSFTPMAQRLKAAFEERYENEGAHFRGSNK